MKTQHDLPESRIGVHGGLKTKADEKLKTGRFIITIRRASLENKALRQQDLDLMLEMQGIHRHTNQGPNTEQVITVGQQPMTVLVKK